MNPRKAFEKALSKTSMLSTIPIDLKTVDQKNIDKEILRLGIIAELDAVSLYEQMADFTKNDELKEVLLDVAKEEKTHVGEFQTLLLKLDPEYAPELESGKKEVIKKESSMNPRKAFEEALKLSAQKEYTIWGIPKGEKEETLLLTKFKDKAITNRSIAKQLADWVESE
jgi:rubrerythrin